MGGTNDPSNLVELTVEEHAEAHKKLYEEFGRWQDEIAYKMLSGQINMSETKRLVQWNGSKKAGQKNKETGHMGKLGKLYGGKYAKSIAKPKPEKKILTKEQLFLNRSKGGKIGGKRASITNMKSGQFENARKLATEATRGKNIYHDPNTGKYKFFNKGEQPETWIHGKKKK